MPSLSKRTTKNKPARALDGDMQSLKRLLRQMVRNEFFALVSEVSQGYAAKPARGRLIE